MQQPFQGGAEIAACEGLAKANLRRFLRIAVSALVGYALDNGQVGVVVSPFEMQRLGIVRIEFL